MTTQQTDLREKIVDAALELADSGSWESLRLHQVAAALGIDLAQIASHFREKEEIAEAWFDRADRAMLAAARKPEFDTQPRSDRLRQLVLAWLAALAPYHRVTREMILVKLEPGHLHVQLPALLRISRTVQWLREASGCRDSLPRRAFAEVAWSSVFVSTFIRWLNDHHTDRHATAAFLDRAIRTLANTGLLGTDPVR